jgi:hypothetical protein
LRHEPVGVVGGETARQAWTHAPQDDRRVYTDGMNIADIRKSYEKAELSEAHSQADPLMQFDQWLKEAIASEVPEPNAMTWPPSGPTCAPAPAWC